MKKAKITILSILTVLCIYSERVLKEMAIAYKKIKTIDIKALAQASYSNTEFLMMFILTIALIVFYKKYKDIKREKSYNILSFIFALFLVFGFSYSVTKNSSLVTGNFLLFSLSAIKLFVYYYFLSTIINIFASKIKTIDLKKIKAPKFLTRFEKYYELHPFKTTILVILICWLPYIISFYPAILSPDPSNQIKQYFGIDTHYIEGVKLIDENVKITNHHPVFHTFILGGCAKIGDMMGNINIGLFLFTCFQLFIVISAMTYLLIYLKKLKLPFIYRLSILIIFALVPVFPLYALSSVKDTMFGALLVFFIIELHKIFTSKYSLKEYIVLTILLLILMLVRNNGVYIILITMLTLIVILKEKRIALIIVVLSSFFAYEAHNRILLPAMHITPGSIREMLSVPFQQTARYVKYYEKDVKPEEKDIIDKILGFDTLATRYKPNIADPVKNEFNKETTKDDLIEYFKVWFSEFLRHPGVYFDATINTIYGYFYPNTSNWYVYHEYDERLIESGIDYHYNKLTVPRTVLSSYAMAFPYIPVLGSLVNIGFNVWIYLFLLVYLITEKKKHLIVLLLPALTLLLTCVVGPVNTYFRYMFPIVISLPLIIGLLYHETIMKKSVSKN